MDPNEIDARNVKRALETTQGAPDDPAKVDEKIQARRQKLETLNDEVEAAQKELQEAQEALAEEEMKEMNGQAHDVSSAETAVQEAHGALEEKRSMLSARADALKSAIEELEGQKIASEVRQKALQAKDINETAAAKMQDLHQKVQGLKDLNQEVADLCQKARSITLDANHPEVRGTGRRKNGLEVQPLFLEGLNERNSRQVRVSGSSPERYLNSAAAMLEEGEKQYWPSTMWDQLGDEDGFSLSDLLPG